MKPFDYSGIIVRLQVVNGQRVCGVVVLWCCGRMILSRFGHHLQTTRSFDELLKTAKHHTMIQTAEKALQK